MRKNFTRLAFVAAVTLAVSTNASAQLNSRTAAKAANSKAGFVIVTDKAKAAKAKAAARPSDYGTEELVAKEDFSKMSMGTENEPDLNVDLVNLDSPYPWTNMVEGYTTLSEWGCSNAFPAGGALCLHSTAEQDFYSAHVNTPRLDLSNNGGIAWIRFKARTISGTSDYLFVEAAETNNMGPSWDIMGSTQMPTVTDEWQEFVLYFYGGGKTSIFNFVSYENPILLDDIEVFTVKQHVATPVVLPHSKYLGESFNANWTKVDGAEKYALNVYQMDMQTGEITDYLLENKEVTDTTFNVTGAESGATYFYDVVAKKGSYSSIPAKNIEVFDIAAPVLNEATNVTDGSYTATWAKVPTAERYNYTALYERKADKAGEFVITDEHFTGVKNAEGELTGWTAENPNYQTYSEFFIPEMIQQGWKGTWYAPYTDYICLDGWHYAYNQGDAGLTSPELDLSKDGGKVNVSVKLRGAKFDYEDEAGKAQVAYTQAAFALFNYNEAIEDYEQAELIYAGTYPNGVNDTWKNFDITFTKGTSRSIIGIYAVYAPENLYIDDLKITQNYKAGETFLDPFKYVSYNEGESVDVEVPVFVGTNKIYHRATAVKTNTLQGSATPKAESKFSETKLVGTVNSVSNVNLSNAYVQVTNNGVCVNNVNGESVNIYNISGQLVYNNNSGEKQMNVALQNGTYIVKVGNKSIKLVF